MPRQARIDVPGLLYHITARGIEKTNIFNDDNDRNDFIQRLSEIFTETGTECYAWVLMPNHFHLLIRTKEKPLKTIMSKLLTGYAISFNLKYDRKGHLFQNRYHSKICKEDEYFLSAVRYIHLNPIRAKIVSDLDELSKYKWSGHRAILGISKNNWQNVKSVLVYFSNEIEIAKSRYLDFLSEGLLTEASITPFSDSIEGNNTIYFNKNTNKFNTIDNSNLIPETSNKKVSDLINISNKIDNLDTIILNVSNYYNLTPEKIFTKSRLRQVVIARAIIVYVALRYLNINGVELSRKLNMSTGNICHLLNKGEYLIKNNNILNIIFKKNQ